MMSMIVEMKMFKYLLLACFALVAAVPFVLAQPNQSGFISIDCGLSGISNYIDQPTKINYTSDAGFIDSGMNVAIPLSAEENRKPFLSVRSFPEGKRNCYTLRPENGKDNKYLIRARFVYGNYDGKNQLPRFDLYIGEDFWTTMSFKDTYDGHRQEIIHISTTDYIHVCLLRTGETIPFISALELRPLNNTLYTTQSGSLQLYERWNLGVESDEQVIRYPDDVYDRMWLSFDPNYWRPSVQWSNTTSLSTNQPLSTSEFQLPSAVMRTAITPQNSSDSLVISWKPYNSDRFYIYLHFAEVQQLRSNESRQSQMYFNGQPWFTEFSPNYLQPFSIRSTDAESVQTKYELSINSTPNSTLAPIINAIEIYRVKYFKTPGTYDNDVAAMFGIKSYYGLRRNWQGNPCGPPAFRWDGLSCNDDYNPRVISLNLSSSGLNGSISPHIANLISIQILDLSNNNLSGNVPDFLAQLAALTFLNLTGNNFSGPIPTKLQEKAKQGLFFSIDELPNNTDINTGKKKNKVALPIVASTIATLLVVFVVSFTACTIRRRKESDSSKTKGALETKNHLITYSEVLKITNNFERVLGKGGFGTVYHGFIGDTQVAVKMLNPLSAQGHKEFQAEATLLMSVHHKNLTSLVGYCNEDANIGIIYEYMANGNLQQRLSELSWEQRLRIAVDAAQGLEYLHHGCKPSILHRDVKPTNILLNEMFQAKLSDFGLSRAFPIEGGSHVSINTIAGSPGYVDPECHSSYKLTEKSDVYSFGIVILEIITGRPALDMNREKRHIIDWVVTLVENGDIRAIVDERLKGNFNINSAWKAVEVAISCVSRPSSRRPTMNDVVIELKQCLAIETSNIDIEPSSLTGPVLESEYGPLVR